MSEKKYTESEWRTIEDLRKNWHSFCDCDVFDGCSDFIERMEIAGFVCLRKVTRRDLETPFASELGIEKGGNVWRLTASGRKALEGSAL